MAVMTLPAAIPIPRQIDSKHLSSTTPSLQSVLDQKRLSNQAMRFSLSSSSASTDSDASSTSPSSVTSLLSLDALESCTHSHPLDDPPLLDYLTDIDNDFFNDSALIELVEPLAQEPLASSSPSKPLTKKPSFVSQLSKSLRSFTNSTEKQNNELVFDIQPRLTDDKLPSYTRVQNTLKDRELETFKVTSLSHSPSVTTLPSFTAVYRNREPRINSQFLRLYSHESASRQKGLLPEIAPEEEELYLHNPAYYRGTEREFALLVRQRLWNCVVLPPREDALLDPVSQSDEYVYDRDDEAATDEGEHDDDDNELDDKRGKSLMETRKHVMPWVKLEDETEKNTRLGPRGVLNKGVQFTVKGWSNARWVPTKI